MPHNQTSCCVEGCQKPTKYKDLCQRHYDSQRERTDCKVTDCLATSSKYGLCTKHYLEQPNLPTCCVDNCTSPVFNLKHQICRKHYRRRLKTGKTSLETNSPAESKAFLNRLKRTRSTETECILWPYKVTPHGYAKFGKQYVHSLLLTHFVGSRPENHHACHNCGNSRCVNINHLRWGTAAENAQDKARHGTLLTGEKHPNAKLTNDQVLVIRKDPRATADIARDYHVSSGCVGSIKSGSSWKALT